MSLNKPIKYLYFLLYISQTLFPKISTWKSKSTLHIGERFILFSLFYALTTGRNLYP
jgi:hypothetical protein